MLQSLYIVHGLTEGSIGGVIWMSPVVTPSDTPRSNTFIEHCEAIDVGKSSVMDNMTKTQIQFIHPNTAVRTWFTVIMAVSFSLRFCLLQPYFASQFAHGFLVSWHWFVSSRFSLTWDEAMNAKFHLLRKLCSYSRRRHFHSRFWGHVYFLIYDTEETPPELRE